MHFLAILISLVSCGSFLATTAVPVPGTVVQFTSSQDLGPGTSIIQTRDANSSYDTSFNLRRAGEDEAHSESQIQPSDFIKMAWFVSITLLAYKDPNTGQIGIAHAFDGDIKKAFDNNSATGPFETISIIVLDNCYSAALKALRHGRSERNRSLKVEGPDDQLEAKFERVGLPTISAPIKLSKGVPQKPRERVLESMPGHKSDIYGFLPIYKGN